jgi:hypothetical protein
MLKRTDCILLVSAMAAGAARRATKAARAREGSDAPRRRFSTPTLFARLGKHQVAFGKTTRNAEPGAKPAAVTAGATPPGGPPKLHTASRERRLPLSKKGGEAVNGAAVQGHCMQPTSPSSKA